VACRSSAARPDREQLGPVIADRRLQAEGRPLLGPEHRQVDEPRRVEAAGSLPLIAALTSSGPKNASDRVMRIERSLLRSRSAGVAMDVVGSESSSSSQRWASTIAPANTSRARAGIARLGDESGVVGWMMARRRRNAFGVHGTTIVEVVSPSSPNPDSTIWSCVRLSVTLSIASASQFLSGLPNPCAAQRRHRRQATIVASQRLAHHQPLPIGRLRRGRFFV